MKWATQSVLLAATWFFLVFPSCPCQFMSLFGVEFHDHGAAVAVNEDGNGFWTAGREDPQIPCHCDEEGVVVAELVETEVEKCGADNFAGHLGVDFDERTHFGVALMGMGEVLRPPPPPLFGSGLFPERSVYSVYRI
jgi:hypothetical protein